MRRTAIACRTATAEPNAATTSIAVAESSAPGAPSAATPQAIALPPKEFYLLHKLLRDPATTSDERQEYTSIIAKESKRLVSLSSDILALRQTEALDHLPQTDISPIRIDEQLRQTIILMQEKWQVKHLNFDVKLRSATMNGHERFLAQMWTNLIDNACKFSPKEGRVRVSMQLIESSPAIAPKQTPFAGKTKRATMRSSMEPAQTAIGEAKRFAIPRSTPTHMASNESNTQEIVVRIENDGPELSADALGRIFDRFYQNGQSHATQGCGLGLPLVKRVAQLHGGSVVATSEHGHTALEVQFRLQQIGE